MDRTQGTPSMWLLSIGTEWWRRRCRLEERATEILSSQTLTLMLPTYESSFHIFVQDDYIASCVGIKADTSTLEIPQFAHSAKGSFHQPLTMQISIPTGTHEVSRSRRVLPCDKRKLKEPAVIAELKVAMNSLRIPNVTIEQTSRAFIIDEAMLAMLRYVAPREKQQAKQPWLSEDTRKIIAVRNEVLRSVSSSGRALEKFAASPLETTRKAMMEAGDSWGEKLRPHNGTLSLNDAVSMAYFVREEREAAQASLVCLNCAVEEAVLADKAKFEIRRS